MNYYQLLQQAIQAAIAAGKEIIEVYQTEFEVEYKDDKSPVTLADKRASDKIAEILRPFQFPVLSEEGKHEDFRIRQLWKTLWIIDPLDGTKEFVKRNGEFTVNIALVENNIPTLGVIYAPILKQLYFSAKTIGAYKINQETFEKIGAKISTLNVQDLIALAQQLPIIQKRQKYVVVASRSHMSSETYQHIEKLKSIQHDVEIVNIGSSIKMCWVAEGVADEYPRFGPTMEWDTASGQAILQESAAELIDLETAQPMQYNREHLLNNWFIAKRK